MTITDRTQKHIPFPAGQIREISGPYRINTPLIEMASHLIFWNDALGSWTVVRVLNVRGLIPAIPIDAIIFATVFSLTVSPRSRSSLVTRGEPYVPFESECVATIFMVRSCVRCCRGVGVVRACRLR